ncbi:hypothetical protein F4823DRAFT_628820 [Ustulina deusta]|nr:hypothetical protein F4823DRAFT_628820 [Ustulina deusta]
MAPTYAWTNYADERRSSSSRRESYRPGAERPQPARRDSRDGRHANESGGLRSPSDTRPPREHRRDNEPPRPHGDANFTPPEGPKRPSKNPAAGAPDKLSDGLNFKPINIASDKHIATNNSVVGNSVTPAIPKAKNPKLQEAFENAYNLGETVNKRVLLRIRKKKLSQERTQQRLENEKFLREAAAYPPYHGLGDKFSPTDRALDDEIKVNEDGYLRDLEQFVAHSATTNHQDPMIAALETKVEQISQQLAKQTEQIQSLLEENKKYSALKSDHDALQLKICTLDDKIQAFQSLQVTIDTENKSLKKQLEDLQSNTEKNLNSSNAQLTELIKQSSSAGEARKVFEIGLDQRITGIEVKLNDFTDYDDIKDKLDELDLVTFNEVCSAWVDSEYNLKAQHNEYKQRRRQDDSSIHQTPQPLCKAVDSLRASQANVSQLNNGTALSMETIKAAINTAVAAAAKSMSEDTEKLCQGRDELIGGMIDNTVARIDALERGGASNHLGLEARIQLLEQWRVECSAWIDQRQGPTLAQRVTSLEGKKVGHRVDRIDLEVGDLNRKHEALKSEISQFSKREWIEVRLQELLTRVGMNPAFVGDVKNLQLRLPALELAIKTLDLQFQNLSTKQLAEYIVGLTNPEFEQRLGKLEVKANQLEVKADGMRSEPPLLAR